MDNLLTRQFKEHNITVYGIHDKPLFKAKDIGDLLDIGNIRESIKDFSDKQINKIITDTGFGMKETLMLTEQGVYKLVMRSRKPRLVRLNT